MPLEALSNVPVHSIDTTIDVVSRGDGSHDHDDVYVTVTMQLLADVDAAAEAVLLLPMAAEAQQQPLLRYTGEALNGPQTFTFDPVQRSVYDQEVVDSLAAMADGPSKKEQKALATDIARAASSLSQTVVTVKPGQRQLRLFYGIAADKVGDREFEFSVIGPLPSFVIQAGGSIGIVTLLARGTSVVSAVGLTDPANAGSEIPKLEADLGGRHLIGWTWQNDPLFKVHYRY
jgi:hypothetical protein